jgi:hypothetical protein
MQKNWQSSMLAVSRLIFFFLLGLPSSVASQNNSRPASPVIPAELTATDPEIRALLNDEYISCKASNTNERVEKFQKAFQIANDRGLIRDRAVVEAVMASALVGEGKMEMAFLAAKSQAKLVHGIQLVIARNYIENLKEEVKKGMREKAEQGIYPSRPPLGYQNNRLEHTIEIDPRKAPIARRMFELYASGHYSLTNLRTVRGRSRNILSKRWVG